MVVSKPILLFSLSLSQAEQYLIFKFTYLNTFSMYNMKPMGLLGDIKFFYLDEMSHQ